MCGIAGYLTADPQRVFPLASMVKRLRHRGPDELGLATGYGVGLGSARLALVGGERGRQPIRAHDGESLLVLNGEIYNWQDLTDEGETSDTQVALQVLGRQGAAGLARFKGGFAVAYYDARRQSLLLARDHFGQKPLYLREEANALRFASEPIVLFDPEERPELDQKTLSSLLRFQFLPPGESLFCGITVLRPGTWVEFARSAGGDLVRSAGQIPWPEPGDETIFSLFNNSCHRQAPANENAALLLSGGLDSTAVLGGLLRTGRAPTQAFVGYFPDGPEAWDERVFARCAADAFEIDLVEVPITPQAYAEVIPSVVQALGEPIAGPGAASQYILCHQASANHRVLLVGKEGTSSSAATRGCEFSRFCRAFGGIHTIQPTIRSLVG